MSWLRQCRPFLLLFSLLAALSVLKVGAARTCWRGIAFAPQTGSAADSLVPWRPLTWDDFAINDVQSGLSAETVSYLRFRYQIHMDKIKEPGGGEYYAASITRITFSGGMDKARSWRRSNVKNNADLLRHEQGHLDLNEIKRRQLQNLPLSQLPVGKGATLSEATTDLSGHLGEWFRNEMFLLKNRQIQYDAETNFSMNRAGQKSWLEQIGKEIAAVPASSDAASPAAVPAPAVNVAKP